MSMIRPIPFVVLALALASVGCEEPLSAQQLADIAEAKLDLPVETEDIVIGEGPPAKEADRLFIEYVGMYPDSRTVFDRNDNKDKDGNPVKPPYDFVLGAAEVIPGWEEGIEGMRVGGERILLIPWQKAYGLEGKDPIDGKMDLRFEVKLLDIVRPDERDIYDVEDLKVGTGREVKEGDRIAIHYRGTYANGMRFDDSRERGDEEGGEPLDFTVGLGHVIVGIDDGVRGMRIGGIRRLRVPPALVFGSKGMTVIKGDQVCYFEIELLGIKE